MAEPTEDVRRLFAKEDRERRVEKLSGCQMCHGGQGLSHGIGLLPFGARETPIYLDIRRKNLRYDEWSSDNEEESSPFFLCDKCRIELLRAALAFEMERLVRKESR